MPIPPSCLFTESDVVDLDLLASHLSECRLPQGISHYVRGQLSPETTKLLAAHKKGPDTPLLAALVHDLNRIISSDTDAPPPSIIARLRPALVDLELIAKTYADNPGPYAEWSATHLKTLTWLQLWKAQPPGERNPDSAVRINRIILEQEYPAALSHTPLTIPEIAVVCRVEVEMISKALKEIPASLCPISPDHAAGQRFPVRLVNDSYFSWLLMGAPRRPIHHLYDTPRPNEGETVTTSSGTPEELAAKRAEETRFLMQTLDSMRNSGLISDTIEASLGTFYAKVWGPFWELKRTAGKWSTEQCDWVRQQARHLGDHGYDLVELMAAFDQGVNDDLNNTIEKCVGVMSSHCRSGPRGNERAARRLITLAVQAAREVERLQDSHPDLVEKIARDYGSWPVMRSHHAKFSRPDSELPRNLGVDYGFGIYRGAQWDPTRRASAVAAELQRDLAYLLEVLPKRELLCRFAVGPDPILMRVRELAPLSGDTAKAWWSVAEALFLRFHPQPETKNDLRGLSAAARKRSYTEFGVQRRQEGRIRQEIIDSIRKSFLYAAGMKRKDPDRSRRRKRPSKG